MRGFHVGGRRKSCRALRQEHMLLFKEAPSEGRTCRLKVKGEVHGCVDLYISSVKHPSISTLNISIYSLE